MQRLSRILKERDEKWAWIGQRGHDALALGNYLPLEFIISCYRGREMELIFDDKDLYPIEAEKGIRKDWSNEHLNESLSGEKRKVVLRRLTPKGKKVNLIGYRSLSVLETLAKNGNFRLLAAPEKLKKKFDNKIYFHNCLDGLGIEGIKGFVACPGELTFSDIRKKLSKTFVLQLPFSSSGLNTFLVNSFEQYEVLRARFKRTSVLFKKYMPGFSVNINAAVYESKNELRTAVAWPSVQITGVPECCNFASSYCGNDYASAYDINTDLLDEVKRITGKVGRWMASSGYRGIFGMDFVLSGGCAYPIEINPRLQNSTSLLTELEAISFLEEDPLIILHLAQLLAEEDKNIREELSRVEEDLLMRPVRGSQITLHNPLQRSIINRRVEPGVYEVERGELKRLKSTASLTPDMPEGSFLITSGLLSAGSEVAPNAPLCKIELLGRAVDRSRVSLKRELALAVKAVYRAMELEMIPESSLKLESHSMAGFNEMKVAS